MTLWMNRARIIIVATLNLSLLLLGCSGEANPDLPPAATLDQKPLVLANPLFQAGYELAGYYELDADAADGSAEALAVLTLKLPLEQSFLGDTYVLLFSQQREVWSLPARYHLEGINARAELRDLTGDGFPELLVFTEEADDQLGDFVTPLHYTDHVNIFSYDPDMHLVELGAFDSKLSGVTHPRSTVGEWGGRPAIQTMHDLPLTRSPLWQTYRVETFAWDGQGFASVQVQERQRLAPAASWLMRRHVPWAAASLALGGILSLIATVVARRLHWRELWVSLFLVLALLAVGTSLGIAQDWLCVPALILIGLAGLPVGRRMATRLVAEPTRDPGEVNAE